MLSGNRSGRIPSAPRRINGRLLAHDVRDVFDQADKCLFAAETPSTVYALPGSASVVVGTHTHPRKLARSQMLRLYRHCPQDSSEKSQFRKVPSKPRPRPRCGCQRSGNGFGLLGPDNVLDSIDLKRLRNILYRLLVRRF